MIVAVCCPLDLLKAHRHGRGLFQCGEKILVLFHVPGQLICANGGKLPPLGLRYVKNGDDFIGGDLDFLCFRDGLPVAPDHRFSRLRVFLLYLLPDFVRRRGKDTDALFPAHYVPSKVIFPCVKSGDKGSVGLLHGDQQRIVEAVIMEF